MKLRRGAGRLLKSICALWVLVVTLWAAVAVADLEKAKALAGQGQDRKALGQLDAVLATRSSDAEAMLLKGVLLTRLGRTDEAKGLFLTLIQEHPELPEPYNNLAALYGASGEYEQAIEVLKLALRTHPSYEIVYENLTRVYGRLAGQAYDRALGVESESPAEPVSLDLLDEVGERLETTPSRIAAARAAERSQASGSDSTAESGVPAEVSGPRSGEPIVEDEPSSPAPAMAPAQPDFDQAAETVRAWAKAWSNQQVDKYLDFYSSRFLPADGLGRNAWAGQRRERIKRPSFITVSLDGVIAEKVGDQTVRVRFRQTYSSDTFSDVVDKTMELTWDEDQWRILSERVDRGPA